ncbi:unnamed protein product, partial [Staurois parvus]
MQSLTLVSRDVWSCEGECLISCQGGCMGGSGVVGQCQALFVGEGGVGRCKGLSMGGANFVL